MTSLEKRNQTDRIVFMYGERRHGFSLKTGDSRARPRPWPAASRRP